MFGRKRAPQHDFWHWHVSAVFSCVLILDIYKAIVVMACIEGNITFHMQIHKSL